MVLYALGFSTNIFSLSYHADPVSVLFYVPGAELYLAAQPFNRLLFNDTVILFVLCLTMFFTLTHRRRLYYISNYVTSFAFGAYCVYLAQLLWDRTQHYKALYGEVDFARLEAVKNMMRMDYSESTFMLDAGMVLSVVLVVMAGFLVVNLVLKTVWMKNEKWLVTAEVKHV